jgi:hypothetical protein
MPELTNGYDLKISLSSGEVISVRFFGEYAQKNAETYAEQILYEKKRSSRSYKISDGKSITPLIVSSCIFVDPMEVLACIAQEAPSVVIQMPVKENEKDV